MSEPGLDTTSTTCWPTTGITRSSFAQRGLRRGGAGRGGDGHLHGLPDRAAGDGRAAASGTPRSSEPPAAGSPRTLWSAASLGVHLLQVDRILIVPHSRCAMAGGGRRRDHRRIREATGADAVLASPFGASSRPAARLAADVERSRATRTWPAGPWSAASATTWTPGCWTAGSLTPMAHRVHPRHCGRSARVCCWYRRPRHGRSVSACTSACSSIPDYEDPDGTPSYADVNGLNAVTYETLGRGTRADDRGCTASLAAPGELFGSPHPAHAGRLMLHQLILSRPACPRPDGSTSHGRPLDLRRLSRRHRGGRSSTSAWTGPTSSGYSFGGGRLLAGVSISPRAR